jgi:hypothetical protein
MGRRVATRPMGGAVEFRAAQPAGCRRRRRAGATGRGRRIAFTKVGIDLGQVRASSRLPWFEVGRTEYDAERRRALRLAARLRG